MIAASHATTCDGSASKPARGGGKGSVLGCAGQVRGLAAPNHLREHRRDVRTTTISPPNDSTSNPNRARSLRSAISGTASADVWSTVTDILPVLSRPIFSLHIGLRSLNWSTYSGDYEKSVANSGSQQGVPVRVRLVDSIPVVGISEGFVRGRPEDSSGRLSAQKHNLPRGQARAAAGKEPEPRVGRPTGKATRSSGEHDDDA